MKYNTRLRYRASSPKNCDSWNVGKAALFNRLVGENRAIVVDEPGVTRDQLYGRSYWGDQEFVLVDTGGVITVSKSPSGVMEELNVSTTIGMEGILLS